MRSGSSIEQASDGATPLRGSPERTYVLEAAGLDQYEPIAAFVERVIVTSVNASPSEKDAFVTNARANLSKWLAAPELCFHVTARSGHDIVGVVLVRDYWNLCHLFVAPEHQGCGLGRRLLEAALVACAGRSPRGRIMLNASRNAVEFYKHMGFSEVTDAPAPFKGMQFERPV